MIFALFTKTASDFSILTDEPNTVDIDEPLFKSSENTLPFTRWYLSTLASSVGLLRRFSTVPLANSPNAASVEVSEMSDSDTDQTVSTNSSVHQEIDIILKMSAIPNKQLNQNEGNFAMQVRTFAPWVSFIMLNRTR